MDRGGTALCYRGWSGLGWQHVDLRYMFTPSRTDSGYDHCRSIPRDRYSNRATGRMSRNRRARIAGWYNIRSVPTYFSKRAGLTTTRTIDLVVSSSQSGQPPSTAWVEGGPNNW